MNKRQGMNNKILILMYCYPGLQVKTDFCKGKQANKEANK